MITAEEARKLADSVWQLQMEQIERGIKETIIMGGSCLYYKTSVLKTATIDYLRSLGYKVYQQYINGWATDEMIISWEEE